uniref:Pyruvate kinase n=1 Tax=Mesocestoides corti TaxID=53468 RepID=A0A5K3F169_MESCO
MEFIALPSMYNSPSNEILFGSSGCWEGKLSSRIGHACQLDIDQVAEFPRATSVVCSLGASWFSAEGIKTMIDNGMNMLRLNLNTLSREMCLEAVKTVRKLEELSNYKHCVAIVMDVTVESIRTGFFQGGPKSVVVFNEGDKVQLTMDESIRNDCTKERMFIDTSNFPQMIHNVYKGDRIFLGDGLVCMIVKEIGMDYINCLVEEGGPVTGYQRVILPRERLYHRSIEASYLKDLAFAAECNVDFVFTSYADNAQMILDAKSRLPTGTKVFANIETKASVRNLAELIEHADGIVVSRAALGLEFPPEKIFKLQKYIIAHCNVARRPVFVIAQLLESMYNKPRPTRAEASDVANAVLDGADGLILTSETSKGIYPHDAVKFMHQICREAERAMFHKTIRSELNAYRASMGLCKRNISHVTALSAVEAAENSNAKGIFVITTTGESAISVACAGPCCPVIAITRHPEVARHCHAYRGVFPFVYTGERLQSWSADVDLRLNAAVKFARSEGIVKPQDTVVIVTGTIAGTGRTNTMQIFKVPPPIRVCVCVCDFHLNRHWTYYAHL